MRPAPRACNMKSCASARAISYAVRLPETIPYIFSNPKDKCKRSKVYAFFQPRLGPLGISATLYFKASPSCHPDPSTKLLRAGPGHDLERGTLKSSLEDRKNEAPEALG